MEYTKLKCINQYKSENINPSKTPNTVFEMYSVPIYETGHPEYLRGDEIASNKVVVQKNDILLCKINPRINRVWVVSDESDKMNIASSEWIVIRNNEYNPEFLAWYFRTPKFQKLMISEVTGIGGSLTRAQPKCVSEYPVPVLEKVKQDEIVNTLNKCKLVLTLRKQELILLDKLIKARFVELFGDVKYGVDRWGGKIFKNITINLDSGRKPVKDEDRKKMQGIYPYYGATGIVDYVNDYRQEGEFLLISEDGKALELRSKPIAFLASGKIWVNNHAHVQQCTDECNIIYLMYHINLMDISVWVTGIDQKKLNRANLDTIPIALPPIELQNQFATFVKQVDKSKFAVQKGLEEAQKLFDSLMQKYFS